VLNRQSSAYLKGCESAVLKVAFELIYETT
jgi:hypothetical protein